MIHGLLSLAVVLVCLSIGQVSEIVTPFFSCLLAGLSPVFFFCRLGVVNLVCCGLVFFFFLLGGVVFF